MNEQIHKLYKQAVVDYGFDYYLPTPTWERFAELIVRECLSKIEDERFELPDFIIDSVKQHFGIE